MTNMNVIGRLSPTLRDLHDSNGNNFDLIDPAIEVRMENGEIQRASGEVICAKCGLTYYQHPRILGVLYLALGCNNEILKL